MNVVISNRPRLAQQVAEGFAPYEGATVHEAGGRTGLLASFMRPIYAGAKIAGGAVTVSVPSADNCMRHVAVEQCQAGDALGVVPTSSCDTYGMCEKLAQKGSVYRRSRWGTD